MFCLFNSQEVRYFSEEYDPTESLQEGISEHPEDVNLWLNLAKRILKSNIISEDNMDEMTKVNQALNVLSKGLEANKSSEVMLLL